MSNYHVVKGINFRVVQGAPVRKLGRIAAPDTTKYAPLFEAARQARTGTYIKVSATNTKGAKLAARVRAALKAYYKGSNQARNYTVMTTADDGVAIVRNR